MKEEKEILKRILKLLSRKDYSEKEIIEKFPEITSTLLEKLKRNKLIDDYSLCQRIVENLKNKGKGYYYILKELERRKINEEIIENFKKTYDYEEEIKRCKNVVKKLKNKKSILLNLKNRGFPDDIIEKVIFKNSSEI